MRLAECAFEDAVMNPRHRTHPNLVRLLLAGVVASQVVPWVWVAR